MSLGRNYKFFDSSSQIIIVASSLSSAVVVYPIRSMNEKPENVACKYFLIQNFISKMCVKKSYDILTNCFYQPKSFLFTTINYFSVRHSYSILVSELSFILVSDACVPSPCQHGGTCSKDAKGLAKCECKGRWSGPICKGNIKNPFMRANTYTLHRR